MAFADGIADFRSDTVTRPTATMLEAMVSAEVGDDAYGEDPTVNALEQRAAELLGKEAGLFVASGSMGNQIALNVHTRPGQEVICGDGSHVRNYERGAPAVISGLQFRSIPTDRGRIAPEQVAEVLDRSSYHLPDIGLLVWENTHHLSGGRVVPAEVIDAASAVCRRAGIPVHLDGARLFNAVAASAVAAARYVASVDSVQFCFSKGLGAPIGSMLVGSASFVAAARKVRARLGGGMRQVGVIAAAAAVALDRRDELAADHAVARRLAEGIRDRFPGSVDLEAVETNMVMVEASALGAPPPAIIEHLAAAGIRVGSISPTTLRFVTHKDVDTADVDAALSALESL